MKPRMLMIIATLIASLTSFGANAQPAPAAAGADQATTATGPGPGAGMRQGGGPRARAPRDCSQAVNPEACTAHRAARQAAQKECQDQRGPARRQCMQQKMPPVDCSKAPNQARCDLHQKAREVCKDKFGPEHKACVREQLGVK